LGVALGVLGVALCVAALVAVWMYYPLGKEKTEEIYARIDETLEQADDRIQIARERIVTINVMTADFRTSLTEWLTDRELDQEHVGRRAEIIAAHLHRARDGLDFASSFLQKVRSAQRLAHPFKKESDTEQLDRLLEELAKVQEHVSDVVDSVDEIRQQAEESGDMAKLEVTIEQAIEKVVRVMEIIDSADDRLATLSTKVAGARSRAEELEAQIRRDLWWGRTGASIVLPWMGLGQIALCILAWHRAGDPR
jgi:DNA repair exonuclease SbcCD ATPase subunit